MGGDILIDDVDDTDEFRNTREAMQCLGYHGNEVNQMFRVLAAILNLGNVEVGVAHSGGEEVGFVASGNAWLLRTAELLRVDFTSLQKWLTHRKIATVREVFTKPLTPSQVRQ